MTDRRHRAPPLTRLPVAVTTGLEPVVVTDRRHRETAPLSE